MAQPTSNRHSLSSGQQILIATDYDPVAEQIKILKECAKTSAPDSRQLQAAYRSTIALCSAKNRGKEAIELLLEAEENMVFIAAGAMRAQLFSTVICDLIANGSHSEGYTLYTKATSLGVWRDQPDFFEKAREKLTQIGFNV